MLLALLGVWYRDVLGAATTAVLPYAEALARFPAYLQQLDMESNGKRVDLAGEPVAWDTGPVVWGEHGTNGHHAFFQLLHQGTELVPCDFIGFLRPLHGPVGHHDLLMANCFAQTEALAFGKTADEVAARACRQSGRAPHLPRQQALHHHPRVNPDPGGARPAARPVRAQGVRAGRAVGVNSFDQWGVELGKALAQRIAPELTAGGEPALGHDSSTNALIRRYRAAR